jgi:hypothetical protein
MERISLKKLNDTGGKEKHRVETSNRLTVSENLDGEDRI